MTTLTLVAYREEIIGEVEVEVKLDEGTTGRETIQERYFSHSFCRLCTNESEQKLLLSSIFSRNAF